MQMKLQLLIRLPVKVVKVAKAARVVKVVQAARVVKVVQVAKAARAVKVVPVVLALPVKVAVATSNLYYLFYQKAA